MTNKTEAWKLMEEQFETYEKIALKKAQEYVDDMPETYQWAKDRGLKLTTTFSTAYYDRDGLVAWKFSVGWSNDKRIFLQENFQIGVVCWPRGVEFGKILNSGQRHAQFDSEYCCGARGKYLSAVSKRLNTFTLSWKKES